MTAYEPGLHKPVPMGTRVKVGRPYVDSERLGTVVGVSSVHVVFGYIVLLDEAIPTDYGPARAIVMNGPEIETPEGVHFRLDGDRNGS